MAMATNNIAASFRAVFSLIAVPLVFRPLVTNSKAILSYRPRFCILLKDESSDQRYDSCSANALVALLTEQSCGPGLHRSQAEQQHPARDIPSLIHTHISRFT